MTVVGPQGIIVLDKPAGPTSHAMVARARKAWGTRRVGHAGTLDPMATGVLVLGIGSATRLLGHLSAQGKEYLATMALGVATTTDDAQGSVTAAPGAIATRGLVADALTQRAIALRASPNESAETLEALAAGRPLIRLADTAQPGWALVATPEGILGYVPSTALGARTPQTAAAPRAAREIQIAFPAWDPGRAGRRITVADPGFVSLVGRVRADAPLTALRIADAQVVFNADGSFTAVVEIPREGRRVRIDAAFSQGPGVALDFEVLVGQR